MAIAGRMYDEQTLADLQKVNPEAIFESDALSFGGKKHGEGELINAILDDIQTLRIGERTVNLPGIQANRELIRRAVAKFKDTVYEGDIAPAQQAGHDDIVVQLADTNVFENNVDNSGDVDSFANNWEQTGLTAGNTIDILPTDGDTATEIDLNDYQWMFFTGDFIDLNSDAIITAIQYSNVDGETNYKKESFYPHARDSDIQINRSSGMLVKSRVDLDAFAAHDGDTELFPVIIHIARGEYASELS